MFWIHFPTMGCFSCYYTWKFTTYFGAILSKEVLKVDDALDVVAVHGISGIIGSLSIGFFASKDVNPTGQDGWVGGHAIQICYQLLGVVVCGAWAAFWTLTILFLLKITIGIRISEEGEKIGLGWVEHGEYPDNYEYHKHKRFLKKHPQYDHEDDFVHFYHRKHKPADTTEDHLPDYDESTCLNQIPVKYQLQDT
eukprot:TRINITY_DN1922_c0_g1_i21.p1 TRINITY_DN1922_c0_g1~~TRINITY_DN1922_c0_g1_i21.p1  ORF type:complete len:195 (-),score=36.72 TRINITY_DN1922_c0_g1_i21:23-607(-)